MAQCKALTGSAVKGLINITCLLNWSTILEQDFDDSRMRVKEMPDCGKYRPRWLAEADTLADLRWMVYTCRGQEADLSDHRPALHKHHA